MSNILEPNFNGLPKPTDWKKVIVPLQQANEKEFRGATLPELANEMLKDKTINGQRMKAVPPGALPAGPTDREMYMELLSEGTWTWNGVAVVTNTKGSISNAWWNKVTWSKDDGVELPKGAEILNNFGNSKVSGISQAKVSEISETLEYVTEPFLLGDKKIEENIGNVSRTTIVAYFLDIPLKSGNNIVNIFITDINNGTSLTFYEFTKNSEGLYNRTSVGNHTVQLGVNKLNLNISIDGNRLGFAQSSSQPIVGSSTNITGLNYSVKGLLSPPNTYANYGLSNVRFGMNIESNRDTFKLVDNLKEDYEKSKNEFNDILETDLLSVNSNYTSPTQPSRAFIIDVQSKNDIWVNKLNIVRKGKILLREYSISLDENRISVVREITKNFDTLGENNLDFKISKGNYFGWGYVEGLTGRIGVLETSATYSHYRGNAYPSAQLLGSKVNDYRFAISIIERNINNSASLSKVVYSNNDNLKYILDSSITGYVKFVKKLGVRFDHVHLVRYNNLLIMIGQFFYTSYEDFQKSSLVVLISEDNGQTWRTQITKEYSTFAGSVNVYAESNPDVYQLENGDIFILFMQSKVSAIRDRALLSCVFNVRTLTFEQDSYIESDYTKRVTTGGTGGKKLQDGRIIFPLYIFVSDAGSGTSSGLVYKTDLLISNDNGITWSRMGLDLFDTNIDAPTTFEPGIYQLNDSRLVLYYRTLQGWSRGRISSDGGNIWGESFNLLKAPNSMSNIMAISTKDSENKSYYIAIHNWMEGDVAGTHGWDRRFMLISGSLDGINFKQIGYVYKFDGVNRTFEPSLLDDGDFIRCPYSYMMGFDKTGALITSFSKSELMKKIEIAFKTKFF